jgi:hypothetical protein
MELSLVTTILNFVIKNKEKTCTFVQNEVYPEGVYRIHYSEFIPQFLNKKELRHFEQDVRDYIKWLYEKTEDVVWDQMSLWLTIKK